MDQITLLSLWILGALAGGTLSRLLGLPPLVGFLLAGVVGSQLGFQSPAGAFEFMAHLGVELLLFTIGLKIRITELVRPLILTTGLAQLGVFGVAVLPLVIWFQPDNPVAYILAIGLAFSSTVMAAKVLEARRETRAFHGRLTIGVLVLQDVVAVVLLSMMEGSTPSPWALALLVLPLVRPVLYRLLDALGDGELQVIGGAVLSLVIGAGLFKFVGLSGELGALVMGSMLAGHAKAKALSENLWSFRELLLVGFFLMVGTQVDFDLDVLLLVLGLTLLLPIKGLIWLMILTRAKLRSYTAFLASASLFSYSEFALLVAAGATSAGLIDPRWLGAMALAVVVSFVLSAPLARSVHGLYDRLERRLGQFERADRHPDDTPLTIGNAQVLVMGMGRVGTGAYLYLCEKGVNVVGLDADPTKIGPHCAKGREVLFADADDPALWRGLRLDGVEMIILAMPDQGAQSQAAMQLRKMGFTGRIVSGARNQYAIEPARQAGADMVYDVADAAGVGLGERALECLERRG